MFLYSIVFTIISIIAIIWLFTRYRDHKHSFSTFLLWCVLWIMVAVFALVPEFSALFASFFGISRGLDFIIIVSIICSLYLVLRLYFRLENLQEQLDTIVKELALKNEIDLEDKDSKK